MLSAALADACKPCAPLPLNAMAEGQLSRAQRSYVESVRSNLQEAASCFEPDGDTLWFVTASFVASVAVFDPELFVLAAIEENATRTDKDVPWQFIINIAVDPRSSCGHAVLRGEVIALLPDSQLDRWQLCLETASRMTMP